jgi:hypothetical protein
MSSLQQNWREGQNRFCLEQRVVLEGRNDPNKIGTYEYMNQEGKKGMSEQKICLIN